MGSTLRYLVSSIAVVALTGCASLADNLLWRNDYYAAVSSGQCDKAEQLARGWNSEDYLYLYVGVVESDCRHSKDKAIQYLNVAARMGNAEAPDILIRLGASVPGVDRSVPNERDQRSRREKGIF